MDSNNLPPVIQALLQPTAYPHPVTEPIELIQTHVSYVFLTGEFVYKLKKPVNFGFLDFSTLDKRQHFCHEELRLNQRAAAALYLKVVPVTAESGLFRVDGSGETVEYAVKMQQFPQSALLSEMFERQALTEQHMIDLAQALAEFHAQAEINDHIRSYGSVAKIRQAFDENYAQTTGFTGGDGPQTQVQFDQTQAYSDRFFDQNAAVLADRVTADKIRECHGDAHLRNIALWQDRLWLFDCIEFNEPFRFVDTMYDVGFICMDLDARGRSDLANAFLNAYLEQTGDWQGLQVLPLYLSRQAYVRAKVTSFMLGDDSVPAATKAEASQTAADYYRLAHAYTQASTGPGRLIMMAGLSGSGKSTTAKVLARKLQAIHLRSDAVRKHLGQIGLMARGGPELYSPEMTKKTYARLLEMAQGLVAQGYTVILDAKYDQQALRAPVLAQFPQATILHCDAPRAELERRVAARVGDIADATPAVLAQQTWEAFAPHEQSLAKSLDTTQDIEAQLKAAGF
jgi:uncharacterized protein